MRQAAIRKDVGCRGNSGGLFLFFTLPELVVDCQQFPLAATVPVDAREFSTADTPVAIVISMKYEELLILLPCHSLEDFPLYHEGEDAQGLLANWTALWHPVLLASAGSTPTWGRVDSPPATLTRRLIVVPSVGANDLPTGFAQRAKEDSAVLIRKKHDRQEILDLALAGLEGDAVPVEAELAADFLALGYCYLQVQLLTRQMRYASNLDEIHFRNQAVAGAKAAVAGDLATAREKLAACFDVLAEERNHYYPVDAFTIDIVLTAATTLGPRFGKELESPAPLNILISGEHCQLLAGQNPSALERLKGLIEEGRLGLIGGEATEARLPLLSCESVRRDWRRGLDIYRSLLGQRPTVFGRRRSGLSPMLPQWLVQHGFSGALHAACDDGKFPEGSQIKTRWEGIDGSVIDAIARSPLDAARPETYLRYATRLGESMDVDHVATLCLAHWPGGACLWHDDLRRISRYTNALGKFVTVQQYFTDSQSPGQLDRFTAGQYRMPYLKQAVLRNLVDPISSSIRYWRRQGQLAAIGSLHTLNCLVQNAQLPAPLAEGVAEAIDQWAEGAPSEEAKRPQGDSPAGTEAPAESEAHDEQAVDRQLGESLALLAEQFAAGLPQRKGPEVDGWLVVNPHAFVRRVGVVCPGVSGLPVLERPVYAASRIGDAAQVVVDAPSCGFAWFTCASAPAKAKRPPKPLAEGGILRNEYFEAIVNATTGALQSVHEYDSRKNRISQQLAFRISSGRRRSGDEGIDPDELAEYSVMAADSVETTVATEAMGEVVSRGRLLDRDGKTLAGFRQTFRLWRGSRVLWLEMELDPKQEPALDPWNSYYASRFAWADESAELTRAIHQTRQAAAGKRMEAPQYIDLEVGEARTTILTGGLPFHRRIGFRMLDSLLIVRGERQRCFTMGIGIDLSHPQQEAEGMLAPPLLVKRRSAPPAPADTSWLLHLDAKNVITTSLSPLFENGPGERPRLVGFRAGLLETAGRPARPRVGCFRSVVQAHVLDSEGRRTATCEVQDGRVFLELCAHQWTEIEARFTTE